MPEKHIFQKYTRPQASFIWEGVICTGELLAYWEDGLELRIKQKPGFDPVIHTYILNLCIGENGNVPPIRQMRVARVVPGGGGDYLRLELSVETDEERAGFKTFMKHLLNEGDDFSGAFDQSKIPRFSRKEHYCQKAVENRLKWARAVSGARLENIAKAILQPESLAGNIENYIGAVQIPVGLAGPILVKGTYVSGYVPLPIATTEGALVSSISRGAKACSLAGGVHVHVFRQHMVRAPVFFCNSLEGAVNLERWVHEHFNEIKERAESVSSVARLEKIRPVVFGNVLHLTFYFSTGDASGQNMTSACTWIACEWIADNVKDDPFIDFVWYNIEANMSGDKKANYQNLIDGRGVGVAATCFVPGKVLKRILRVTPEKFVRIWSEAEFSAQLIGMMGSNINFANVIAGIFTATGQDIACVHESSCGIFKAVRKGDGLLFSAHLPSLVMGTVGGGTNLPVQRECLELMGCRGPGKLFRFAEIVAAACLALDISTGAAIVTNDFVSAHERLGRNRPTRTISKSDINEQFFTTLMDGTGASVIRAERLPRQSCSGIISSITEEANSVHGLFRYLLTIRDSEGSRKIPAFLKLKASGRLLDEIGLKVAKLTGEDVLPGLYESQSGIFCLDGSHLREIEIYRKASPELLKFAPKVFGTMVDQEREIYAILMEDLTGSRHFDSIGNIEEWTSSDIEMVIRDMALMHGVYFQRPKGLKKIGVQKLDLSFVSGSIGLLQELTEFNSRRYPDFITPDVKKIYLGFLDNIKQNVESMLSFPLTLTHNDFNPRNLCLRHNGCSSCTVLYDWELAFFQNPQHDLIEFLVFVLGENTPRKEYLRYATLYLEFLQEVTGKALSRSHFLEVLDLNALYLALVRMNLYLLGHNILKLDFLERVYKNLTGYIMEGLN